MLLPTQLPGAPANIAGVVSIHGQILPVIDIAQVFHLPELQVDMWTPMLWLRTSKRELLMPVAGITEITTIEPELFVEGTNANVNSPLLSGVLAQAKQLLLILDIEALLSPTDEAALQRALADFLASVSSEAEP